MPQFYLGLFRMISYGCPRPLPISGELSVIIHQVLACIVVKGTREVRCLVDQSSELMTAFPEDPNTQEESGRVGYR